MTIDWTVRVTDIVMILAVVAGPIVAVQIAELRRQQQDVRMRRVHVFRTLMATRAAGLAPAHVEALNLVEIEFHSNKRHDRKVVDAWKLYIAHLNDFQYPQESWGARRQDLLVELLHEMSLALGYDYDKSHIKGHSYYPKGYGDTENETLETRRLFLEVLKGERRLPIVVREGPLSGEVK